MSKLRSNIEEKYKIALKEKNEIGIRTYRLIKSAIKEKDISLRSEKNKEGLTDEGILSLFQNLIKQRNESIDMYKKAKIIGPGNPINTFSTLITMVFFRTR